MTETSKAFQLSKQRKLVLSYLHSTESLHKKDILMVRKKEKFARHFLGTALTTVDWVAEKLAG